MIRLSTTWLLLFALAGCAGEVTTIEFGDAVQVSRERFATEIYPILLIEETGAVEGEDLTYRRNCADAGCHGNERPFGELPVLPGDNDDNALNTFKAGIDKGYINLGDADDSSFLQHTFMDGTHPTCFPSRDDCCFLKVEAWLNAEDPPACDDCPLGESG
jgi:hypothetical protein